MNFFDLDFSSLGFGLRVSRESKVCSARSFVRSAVVVAVVVGRQQKQTSNCLPIPHPIARPRRLRRRNS